MTKSGMGAIFHIKNQLNILVLENYYMNYQNDQNLILLSSNWILDDDASILVYKYRPERTVFNMYAENTQNRN